MRAAEQGPKQESIKGWNISIQTFSYSVKFDVREKQNKKKGGFTEMSFFCRGQTWQKIWHTAMAEENVLDEERYFFVLKIWLVKVHYRNEGCLLVLPPDVYFGRVRLGRSNQRLSGRRVVTYRPDSKFLRDFPRLPTAFHRGFEPCSFNLFYRYLQQNS